MEKIRLSGGTMKNFRLLVKRILKSPYLALILRCYIGIVFVSAAMGKIHHPSEFSEAVAAYRLLPYWSVNIVAVVLPWTEIICGLFLIIGLRTRASAFVIGALLSVYATALTINLLRGAPISCGCFDEVGDQIRWQDVFRDIGWLLLTVQVFLFDRIYLLRRDIFRPERRIKHFSSVSE